MNNTKIISNKPVKQNFKPGPIAPDHYIMGAGQLPLEIIFPDGHGWGPYLPLGETQSKNGIDPATCPAGGSLNCVEAIGKKKFGAVFQNDLSERYLSIMSGMNGQGGNVHAVLEVMRTISGAIPEVFLPFSSVIDSLKKYFSPRPMTYSLFKVGVHWLQTYDFKHEWIFVGADVSKKENIKTALKSSPVGVSGYAWSLHDDGKYYKDGPDIHWFTVYDYVEGEYWLAFDTYDPYIKKLDWNYDFGYAKRFSLNRKLGAEDVPVEPQSAVIPYVLYLISWALSIIKK